MQQIFNGVLYLDTRKRKMRLTKGRGSMNPYEVAVQVKIVVNVPPKLQGLLEAEIDIPPIVIASIEKLAPLEPLEA